ncbi:MAG: DUF6737 family protein [Cyanobacteria bacterium J06623_7]
MKSPTNSTNVWDYKPGWCQPWSIMLTGISAITVSWLLLHNIWISLAVLLPVAVWWVYFLVIYPKAFAEYVASQQTKLNLD